MAYKVTFVIDDLAWRVPHVRARRLEILRRALGRLQLDHALHYPRHPDQTRIVVEHEGPSHNVNFEMDGFAWEDRKRAHRRMQILLDALTGLHLQHFAEHPQTPGLYKSGVVYEREPPGREDWQDIPTTLRRGSGDCEDLATYRAADLMRRGIPARAIAKPRPMVIRTEDGPALGTLWHILTRWPNGAIEDPSLKLGMEGSA